MFMARSEYGELQPAPELPQLHETFIGNPLLTVDLYQIGESSMSAPSPPPEATTPDLHDSTPTKPQANPARSTFSPEGRLFQVEYSLEAIKLGSTAIGVSTSEGVILGVEKRVTSTLLETSSVEKIVEVDRHIGCAMSGLQADARSMVEHARVECQSHAFNYNEALGVESCTQAICDLALRFGEGADGEDRVMSRPFGVALLIAGIDEDGPQLFHAEPSGTFYRYDAKAIGSGSEGAQAELQNEYHKVGVIWVPLGVRSRFLTLKNSSLLRSLTPRRWSSRP